AELGARVQSVGEALEPDWAGLAHGSDLPLRGALDEKRVRFDPMTRSTRLPMDVFNQCSHRYVSSAEVFVDFPERTVPRRRQFGNRPNVRTGGQVSGPTAVGPAKNVGILTEPSRPTSCRG